MIRVKICGMSSLQDVTTCGAAGADALGFIFAASPRKLSIAEARVLTDAAPPSVTTVGVFANDPAQLVRVAIAQCRLDVLQFSGEESPAYCGSFGKPTMLVTGGRCFSAQELTAARAIAIVVDARLPGRHGGTGTLVDHEAFGRVRAQHPGVHVILAGGLTPTNVGARISASRPDAVDARTGVERDGRKEPALVRAFVTRAREALRSLDKTDVERDDEARRSQPDDVARRPQPDDVARRPQPDDVARRAQLGDVARRAQLGEEET